MLLKMNCDLPLCSYIKFDNLNDFDYKMFLKSDESNEINFDTSKCY